MREDKRNTMRIQLTLKGHCIQTAIKRHYEALLKTCLRSTPDTMNQSDLEQRIEILKTLLEHADFPALRQAHPALSGQFPADVEIVIQDKATDARLEGDDFKLPVQWKQTPTARLESAAKPR
jgi:hypothetical protein